MRFFFLRTTVLSLAILQCLADATTTKSSLRGSNLKVRPDDVFLHFDKEKREYSSHNINSWRYYLKNDPEDALTNAAVTVGSISEPEDSAVNNERALHVNLFDSGESKHVTLSAVVRKSMNRNQCDIRYVELDGTVVCETRRRTGTEIIVNGCSRNQELIISPNGRARCRDIPLSRSREIVVDHCRNDEQLVVNSNGRVRCRKINNTRVVARKGPRRNNNRVIV